ncbi:hypothetical protein ACQEUU_06815 [Nonomuraea sp. CA-218870]|uniref:hypothetical protein n=1 Tax=Nonomuraea sp. CA-218870 TaxID=3239998 RepID=UPI003D9032C5
MTLDPAIIPLIAAGVSVLTAGIAATAALIVPCRSFKFARRLEADKRQFERRAEIYVELLSSLWAIRDAVDPLTPTPATEVNTGDMRDDKARQLVAKVHAFASPEIVEAHTSFSTAFMAWLDASSRTSTAIGEAHATEVARRSLAIKQLRESLAALEQRIRQELQPESRERNGSKRHLASAAPRKFPA